MAEKDDDTEDTTGKADPPEDDEEDAYEPPDQETWSKTNARVTTLNAEAKKWRLRAQGKDPKWKVPTPEPEDDPTDEDEDKAAKKPPPRRRVNAEQIQREAEEAALAKAKPGLVKTAAKDALRAAGLIVPEKGGDAAYARAIRLLDMDEIDVDPDDYTVSGIDDAVKSVRRDYPELFKARGGRSVNAGAGSNKDGAGEKTETSASKLAALVRGGSA